MKFYNSECGMYMEVATGGQWATRDDVEQLERERDLYKKRAVDLIKELEQAAKDSLWAAKLLKEKIEHLYMRIYHLESMSDAVPLAMKDGEYRKAQVNIDRYEGGEG